jgi:putative tryptophan/tyrosine transport system substrate-binding protein
MRRREFIGGLSAALLQPWLAVSTQGQQSDQVRKLGILMNLSEADAESQTRLNVFLQQLGELGWNAPRNLRIEIKWGDGSRDKFRRFAKELVVSSPDVILAASGPVLAELLRETQAIPIVFTQVIDPLERGFIKSLSRPGGNASGFTLFDYSMNAKLLELLQEAAPALRHVAAIYEGGATFGLGQLQVVQSAAALRNVTVIPLDVRDIDLVKSQLRSLAERKNAGVLVTGTPLAGVFRKQIIDTAQDLGLPTVFPFHYNLREGGLMTYGPNLPDNYRRAAAYVDRVLRGAKIGDLPVQNPVKFDLAINLRTAKSIGLTLPPTLLARADEVIE